MSKFKWSIKFDGNEQNDKFPMSPSRSTLVFIGLSLIWWAYVLYLAYCFAFNPCSEIWNPQSMEVFLIRGRGYHSLQRLHVYWVVGVEKKGGSRYTRWDWPRSIMCMQQWNMEGRSRSLSDKPCYTAPSDIVRISGHLNSNHTCLLLNFTRQGIT